MISNNIYSLSTFTNTPTCTGMGMTWWHEQFLKNYNIKRLARHWYNIGMTQIWHAYNTLNKVSVLSNIVLCGIHFALAATDVTIFLKFFFEQIISLKVEVNSIKFLNFTKNEKNKIKRPLPVSLTNVRLIGQGYYMCVCVCVCVCGKGKIWVRNRACGRSSRMWKGPHTPQFWPNAWMRIRRGMTKRPTPWGALWASLPREASSRLLAPKEKISRKTIETCK